MENIIVEIIGAVSLIIVTVLQLRSEAERKRRKAADEKRTRAEKERREDDLHMTNATGRVMLACGELAYVTSLAVTGGHTNGNVEAAQNEFTAAKEEYAELQRSLAEKYLHKC